MIVGQQTAIHIVCAEVTIYCFCYPDYTGEHCEVKSCNLGLVEFTKQLIAEQGVTC